MKEPWQHLLSQPESSEKSSKWDLRPRRECIISSSPSDWQICHGLFAQHAPSMVSTLLEADVEPSDVLNVRRVQVLCLKSEVTLEVYFKQTVAIVIMKVYFRWSV